MEQRDEREMVAALLGARHALYALLARCWDAPLDEATLSLMKSPELEALCCLMDEGAEGAASLNDLRAELVAEVEVRGLDQAERAFNWCFIGIGTRVAPWESVYVSPDRLVFQISTLAVRDAYGAAGFVAKNKGAEPDDHIATECDFMAKLAERAQDAYGGNNGQLCHDALSLSAKFLHDHLAVLNEAVGERLDEAAMEGCSESTDAQDCAQRVYGVLSRFGQGFFGCDQSLLQELLASL